MSFCCKRRDLSREATVGILLLLLQRSHPRKSVGGASAPSIKGLIRVSDDLNQMYEFNDACMCEKGSVRLVVDMRVLGALWPRCNLKRR